MVGGASGTRREQLVLAAFERVAADGFEGLRLRQVAEDVGIDHSTLHHHIATRQELISAVAEHATRQFWATMPEHQDAVTALRAHLDALRVLMADHPALFVVTAELDLRSSRDPAVRSLMEGYESGWRDRLRELWRRGAEQGAWPAEEGEDTVELLVAVVKGVRLTPAVASGVLDRLVALIDARGRGEDTR